MVQQNTNQESEKLIQNDTQYGSISGKFPVVSDFEPEYPQHQYNQDFFSDSESNHPFSSNRATSPAPKSYVWLGYLFAFLSGFCFITANVCIKLAANGKEVSSWQMLFVRCFVQMVGMIPFIFWTKSNIFGPRDTATRLRIAAQGALGGFLLLCVFEAIERLPIGDYTAISFSSPAFTMLLSTFILKEHCGVYRSFIGIMLISGVVIISRPPALFPDATSADVHTGNMSLIDPASTSPKSSFDALGIIFSLGVATIAALITIITKQASHVHFSVLVFWFAIGGQVVSLVGMMVFDTDSLFSNWTLNTWILAFGQAIAGLVGTILITKALRWVSPTQVMVIRTFQVVLSYVIQVEAFGTLAHVSDYAAALLIVSAVLGIGLENRIVNKVDCRYF